MNNTGAGGAPASMATADCASALAQNVYGAPQANAESFYKGCLAGEEDT